MERPAALVMLVDAVSLSLLLCLMLTYAQSAMDMPSPETTLEELMSQVLSDLLKQRIATDL